MPSLDKVSEVAAGVTIRGTEEAPVVVKRNDCYRGYCLMKLLFVAAEGTPFF